MKKILVISDDVIWLPLIRQFSDEIDSKKTELIFEKFEDAFGYLEKDSDIGICAVDLANFDLMHSYRLNDPEYNDPHPEEWQHSAVKLLRNIWCKFRHKKIIIGFYHHSLNEHTLMKFKYKPEIICRVDKLKSALDLLLNQKKYKWIRWDLRGPRSFPQNAALNC